jgi:5-hydroxyisourate hydrolase-like protein (transthyretin family)
MMKYYSLILAFFSISFLIAQPSHQESDYPFTSANFQIDHSNSDLPVIDHNGFKFESVTTGINTEYSDYGVGFFMNKFISLSARKIGILAKKDSRTNEPYIKLYCSDVVSDWDLDRPLLFSHILNKNENLGGLTFSHDEQTIYFTKSMKENTGIFQIYRAKMDPERPGKWIDMKPLSFSNPDYSFENPHLSKDGKTLFFASNIPASIGGLDIFQVSVEKDGSFGPVTPVKGNINTSEDENFPHMSVDGKFLFFSSKGHENAGGYDVFKTRRTKRGYVTILNLGNTINSEKDEIAFIPATDRIGYITSNREGGEGRYDIYKITEYVKPQKLQGEVVDNENGAPLFNAIVHLIDADGTEVGTTLTDKEGKFSFPVSSHEEYTLASLKNGFEMGKVFLNTDNTTAVFKTQIILELKSEELR